MIALQYFRKSILAGLRHRFVQTLWPVRRSSNSIHALSEAGGGSNIPGPNRRSRHLLLLGDYRGLTLSALDIEGEPHAPSLHEQGFQTKGGAKGG
jgi:hypothetical protein